jgi:hypothetical protein
VRFVGGLKQLPRTIVDDRACIKNDFGGDDRWEADDFSAAPDGLSQRTSANQIATPLKSFRANLIPRGRPSTIPGGLRRCPSLAKSTKSPVRASLRVCHWNFAVALCNLRNKFDNEPTRKNLNWTFDEPVSSLPFRRRSDESKESEHLRNRKESSSTR